jgi:hypothetical protein
MLTRIVVLHGAGSEDRHQGMTARLRHKALMPVAGIR